MKIKIKDIPKKVVHVYPKTEEEEIPITQSPIKTQARKIEHKKQCEEETSIPDGNSLRNSIYFSDFSKTKLAFDIKFRLHSTLDAFQSSLCDKRVFRFTFFKSKSLNAVTTCEREEKHFFRAIFA